jgi:uncharacterized glyoxalase superfamily protein PhnB
MFKGPIGVMLYVGDVRRSVDFYRSLGFGLKGYWDVANRRASSDWEGPGAPAYAEVVVADVSVGLLAREQAATAHPEAVPKMSVPPSAEHHLQVDDPDAFHRLLTAKGHKPSEPAETPWGWRMLTLSDPDGHRWNFYKPIVNSG